jgi:hypothetical protein
MASSANSSLSMLFGSGWFQDLLIALNFSFPLWQRELGHSVQASCMCHNRSCLFLQLWHAYRTESDAIVAMRTTLIFSMNPNFKMYKYTKSVIQVARESQLQPNQAAIVDKQTSHPNFNSKQRSHIHSTSCFCCTINVMPVMQQHHSLCLKYIAPTPLLFV